MAYPAMLSASYFQAEARGLDVSTHVEAIAIKVKIISIINEYIKTNRGTISDEVIATVNHMLINEASFSQHFVPECIVQVQCVINTFSGIMGIKRACWPI